MAKKETKVQSNEVEIKAIAKAVGASLTRSGHKVPHSNVLHAVSSALNKRDWQTLKASLGTQPHVAIEVAPQGLPAAYDNNTKFWVRLAYFCGKPLKALPEKSADAMAQARENVGVSMPGVLKWGGWTVPADLTYEDSVVDAGDFKPDMPATSGTLTLRYLHGTVELEVGFVTLRWWYISSKGAADFFEQLEYAVPDEKVLGALDAAVASRLPGPMVNAEFWTDDRVFEVSFDAQEYLARATDDQLKRIIDVDYCGDYATDNIAEYFNETHVALKEAFEYLGLMGRRRETRNDIGFECRVNKEQFLRWMDAHRRPLLAKILCELQEVTLVQAAEVEIAGMWDWLSADSVACDRSYVSQAEAALAAYETLELLEHEING